ncbi:MAG: hypothetical protein EOO42_09280 [Flavobacteriales bacterium]|nr:MAG: hypothetical protein EOO42_09280 [Flavobacteriales bacterium]
MYTNKYHFMAPTNSFYILEQTYDGTGWVAAHKDGSMVITWEDMDFMKTIHVMFTNMPDDENEKQAHLLKMELLVEWLSEYHFEKMHKER